MKFFKFKFYKDRLSDGREGVRLFGENPDHFTPMKIINDFLGEKVLELASGGLMVNLFLPKDKLDQWQKLALLKEAWITESKDSTTINLELLKK